MENPGYIIGIDLGTTNSLAALWRDGKAELIPNSLGGVLTPSVVGLDNEGRVLVGQAARERLLTHPQLTAAVFKRYMGSQREFSLGRRQFRAEELSALVLGSLKADAERHLGVPVTRAVITVPAYFSDAQRKATRIAGELAGLQVECLLNEPTAAALAYGLHEANPESKFLVFDLGGGTFDVSILELFEGVMEVRASGGDNFLGGEDFVQVLVDAFWKEMAGQQLPDRDHPVLQASLRRQAELVKRQLGEAGRAELKLDWAGNSYVWTVTDDQFQRLAEPLMSRLHKPVERALRDARLRASDLDQVVLVGGATRMPLVRRLVARMFGRMPCMNLNPDEAIALGAAVLAGLNARDAALSEVVMTDVCPYTLGISVGQRLDNNEVLNGRYLPIIERNTVVPVSREQTVSNMYDNQRVLKVAIYQGEARLVKDNIFLGSIDVPLPLRKAGGVQIDVRFTYDINGLLEAEMTVQETGAKHQLVIEENPGVLSPEQVQERLQALQALKVHPRDDMVNTTLLARAERLYEESLGDARHYVAALITEFERLLATQDIDLINTQRGQFEERLNQLDGGGVL